MRSALTHALRAIHAGQLHDYRDRCGAILSQVAYVRRRQLEPWWRWTAYLAAGVAADRLVGNLR